MGRVVQFEVEIGSDRGVGLVTIYKDGPGFDVVARDHTGRDRPDWAEVFRRRPLDARRITADIDDREWAEVVRRLTRRLDPARRPHALAAIIVRPER
jgi:hypothetical protein